MTRDTTPLRILHLVDSLRVGGKERQAIELLKGLATVSSVKSLVVTMGTEQFYVPEIEKMGIPLCYLLRRVRWDPLVFPQLWTILRQFRPHIVHTNSEMGIFYTWPFACLLDIKLINATIRNAFSGRGLHWQWHKLMLRLADARVSNSKAGFASRGLRADSPGNYVIYNGLDMKRFQGGVRSERVNTGNHKVVGMVAEFSDYKDFPTFIRAAQLVLARRNDVVFAAVGGGKNLEACKQMADIDARRFQFLGERKDVEMLVQQMDIGVLCTFTEGISNAVMEFMAAGKPVIVTDGGGSCELIEDGTHGFLVPASNPAAVAEKIELLLGDDDKARQMGAAGRRRLEECFSVTQLVENGLRMYREVLGTTA